MVSAALPCQRSAALSGLLVEKRLVYLSELLAEVLLLDLSHKVDRLQDARSDISSLPGTPLNGRRTQPLTKLTSNEALERNIGFGSRA